MGLKIIKENWKGILGILCFLLGLGALCLILAGPLSLMLKDLAGMKDQLQCWGWLKKAGLVALMNLQVIFAFLPGELIEILAGGMYGSIEGMLLCLIGAALGSALIYGFVACFRKHFLKWIGSKKKIKSLTFLQSNKQLSFLVFVLFFIPGTPKDLMTYVMPLTSMKLPQFLIISSFARIPSVITSTLAGERLMQRDIGTSALIFGMTAAVSLIGIFLYQMIVKRMNEKGGQQG